MEKDIFYRLGEGIYRFRWGIIVFSALVFMLCIPILPRVVEPFSTTGFFNENSESAKANKILNSQLGYSYNRFIITYSSPHLSATSPVFMAQIKNSLSGLKKFPAPHYILYPDANTQQVSDDGHTAYAAVMFKSKQEVGHDFLVRFKSFIKKPPDLTMRVGGEPVFLDDVTRQTQIDLSKAEYIGTPAAVLTLLVIFGSLVAALLPLLLGAYCAIVMLTVLYLLAHLFSLSIFTINIALLLGLCFSLDYALFFISRFRNQIHSGQAVKEAIAVTFATTGKTIFFSGFAVFISLSALLFFPVNILFSVGIGGLTAVFVAVIIAMIILPAILSVLNRRIDSLSLRLFNYHGKNYWKWIISRVVKKPWVFLCLILLILFILSFPAVYAKYGISDFRILPEGAQGRQFFDTFRTAFGEAELTPVVVMVKSPRKNILSEKNISVLYDFAHRIQNDSRVSRVHSIVTVNMGLKKKQYQLMYQEPALSHLDPSLKKLLQVSTTPDRVVLNVVSAYPDSSLQTKNLINTLRSTHLENGLTLQVTGVPANTLDVLTGISQIFPYVLAWIMFFTYLVLLVLLRSVILPLKAIVTTILSLTASYGILVFVIQQGHFHRLLNFQPQGILDISLCIIIFCALFGFSMDYEVFLLARIKEYYEKTGDTRKSIISGIDKSSRIITSAAVIVILICFSFMSADILIVKAFGLGIAVAIFVDAFLIRLLLVPAVMSLLNSWNWYLPGWLNRILPEIYFNKDIYP